MYFHVFLHSHLPKNVFGFFLPEVEQAPDGDRVDVSGARKVLNKNVVSLDGFMLLFAYCHWLMITLCSHCERLKLPRSAKGQGC